MWSKGEVMKPVNSPFGASGRLFAVALLLLPVTVFAAQWDAQLQWVRTVPLTTPVSGVIAEVTAERGDRVRADQVLLRLEDSKQQAALAASEAKLKQAENNRSEAQRELERTQELYERTLLADHDLQLGKIQRDAAEAEWLSAKAALVKAQRDLYHSSVRAPFAAWVLQRSAEPGQTVVSELQATPLLVLAEAGRMLARAMVPEATLATLKLGQGVKVNVAGNTYSGKIHYLGLEPASSGGDQYPVDVIFDAGTQLLRAGQAAKVSF
jgi:RND family efflux transporter MFP subunit